MLTPESSGSISPRLKLGDESLKIEATAKSNKMEKGSATDLIRFRPYIIRTTRIMDDEDDYNLVANICGDRKTKTSMYQVTGIYSNTCSLLHPASHLLPHFFISHFPAGGGTNTSLSYNRLNAGSKTQYVQCSQPMWGKCDKLNPAIRELLCPSVDPNADKDEKSHRQNWQDHACCEASPLPWCSHM